MSSAVSTTSFANFGSGGTDILAGAGPHGVSDIIVSNVTGTACVQFFELTAASVSVGTTVPVFTVTLGAASTEHLSFSVPWRCTGLSVFATTASTGSTSASNGHMVQVFVN